MNWQVFRTLLNTNEASIPITKPTVRERLKHLSYRLGANPKRSLRIFLIGLALFAFGTWLIYQGYLGNHLWQVPGISLILIGICFSIYGYIGIFANRWSQFMDRYEKKTRRWWVVSMKTQAQFLELPGRLRSSTTNHDFLKMKREIVQGKRRHSQQKSWCCA